MRSIFAHDRRKRASRVSRRERVLFWMALGAALAVILFVQLALFKSAQKQSGQNFFATVPGIDTTLIPAAQRDELLKELNSKRCPCGCNMSLAQCRNQDPKCPRSLGLPQEVATQFQRAGATP